MLTVGLPGRTDADFNLNVFGLMNGQCSSFVLDANATVTKLELAYTSTAVTAIQIGTDTNR